MYKHILYLVCLLLVLLTGCADRSVDVSAKGQIIMGGSVGKGL